MEKKSWDTTLMDTETFAVAAAIWWVMHGLTFYLSWKRYTRIIKAKRANAVPPERERVPEPSVTAVGISLTVSPDAPKDAPNDSILPAPDAPSFDNRLEAAAAITPDHENRIEDDFVKFVLSLRWRKGWKFGIFLVVVSVAQIVVTKIVLQEIFYTKDDMSKTFTVKEEWKYDCREREDFKKYICFYAEGSGAAGIIAVGQISYSFIGVGQVCFPILLGCGQVVVTSGFALAAQVAVGNISGIAMIAVSSMIGFFNNGWIAAYMKDVPMYGNFCGFKQTCAPCCSMQAPR